MTVTTTMMTEINWNVDGHRLLVTINKNTVDISTSVCPHGNVEGAPCYHAGIQSCVVNYFINVYGLETNHGIIPASDSVEIAWATSGSDWDVDLVEFHMIPVSDPHFADWYSSILGGQPN